MVGDGDEMDLASTDGKLACDIENADVAALDEGIGDARRNLQNSQ